MGKAFLSLLAIFLVLNGPLCLAQSNAKVSDPRLEFKDNRLLISYDLFESNPDEKYIIDIDLKDDAGNIINASTLEGDLGIIEEGGNNKQIIWNLAADSVLINSYVYVTINARVIAPPKPIIVEPEVQPQEEVVENEITQPEDTIQEETKNDMALEDDAKEPETSGPAIESPPVKESASFSRVGLVFQSVAVPGLGMSRLSGKPHWLRAVAGYGCIAGSIVFNRLGYESLNSIEDLENVSEISSAFDKSVTQDLVSETLAYSAIGIWVVDIIWTLAGTSDLNSRSMGMKKGISFSSSIDPISGTPLLGMHYRF